MAKFKHFVKYLPDTLARQSASRRSAIHAGSGSAATKADQCSACLGSRGRLAAVEKTVDGKRKELGIPGASLVIVKDDKVIYMKGLGVKDFEKKVPSRLETLFAIGSATKAFTALAAVMSCG